MSDQQWPPSIKPLTNNNYSFGRGANVVASAVVGGLPRQNLDTTLDAPEFKLNFLLSALGHQVVNQFYDAVINHGANSFKMLLDSGNGVEEHQVYIKPGTWNITHPAYNLWSLSFTAHAEVTSSQLDDCTNLFELYSCYGEDLNDVLCLMSDVVEAYPDA